MRIGGDGEDCKGQEGDEEGQESFEEHVCDWRLNVGGCCL